MIRKIETANLVLLFFVAAGLLLLLVRIDRLAHGVEKLSAAIERHPEVLVATQTFTYGDPSVGRSIRTTWQQANGDTIIVDVYKSAAGESFETQQSRSNAAVAEVAATHPGN